jgi:hypothetical protein
LLDCAGKSRLLQQLKNTMKNLFLVLFLVTGTLSASAQTTQTSDSSRRDKEEIGTTINGLPVLKSYVPPDAVERAKKKYGRFLYSIEKSTAHDCQQSYLIGLIRNGKLTLEWMCDDPKMVLHLYRASFSNVEAAE